MEIYYIDKVALENFIKNESITYVPKEKRPPSFSYIDKDLETAAQAVLEFYKEHRKRNLAAIILPD